MQAVAAGTSARKEIYWQAALIPIKNEMEISVGKDNAPSKVTMRFATSQLRKAI